jgi:uncharacterized protein
MAATGSILIAYRLVEAVTMSRVIFFELPADDPERASAFYSQVFGWRFQKWGEHDYWLIKTGEGEMGIDGGLTRKTINKAVVNTIGVTDLDAQIAAVLAAGGKLLEGKIEVPGMGYLAYCADPEGNAFGMMQIFAPPS